MTRTTSKSVETTDLATTERASTWTTIGALTLGTILIPVALAAAGWAVSAVWFGWVSNLTALLGVVVVGTLAVVILAYAWALLVRGMTAVVRMGVSDALAERR